MAVESNPNFDFAVTISFICVISIVSLTTFSTEIQFPLVNLGNIFF